MAPAFGSRICLVALVALAIPCLFGGCATWDEEDDWLDSALDDERKAQRRELEYKYEKQGYDDAEAHRRAKDKLD